MKGTSFLRSEDVTMKGKQFSDAFILFASLCLHIAVWDSISISIDLNIPIGIKMLF